MVEVPRLLDFTGLQEDVPHLWAEAWHRYTHGNEKYWEIEGASSVAERYAVADPIEDSAVDWVTGLVNVPRTPWLANGKIFFTLGDVMEALGMGKLGANSGQVKNLQGILRKHWGEAKLQRKDPKSQPKKYYVIELVE